jgi:hypothetical protein
MNKITGPTLWRAFAALFTAAFLLFANSEDADAQSKPLAQLHFDGKTPASMKYRDLSISIDRASSTKSPELK